MRGHVEIDAQRTAAGSEALCAQVTVLVEIAAAMPGDDVVAGRIHRRRSEEHTSELQSLMRISYAVFCLKKKKSKGNTTHHIQSQHHPLNALRGSNAAETD